MQPGIPATIHGPRWPAFCAGFLLIVTASVVLAAWLCGAESLVRVLPDAPPMRFNTAALWLLCGVALIGLARQRLWLARCLGAVVMLVALATLSQYLLNFDLRIDNLLLKDWTSSGRGPPGRMAATTALCFVLVGGCLASLTLPDRSRRRTLAVCLCGSGVGALGTVTALGYLAGRDAAYGWFASDGMAIHTAAAFAICGSTIVACALPRERLWSAGGPDWLPLPVMFGLCATAFITWHSLRLEQEAELREDAQQRASRPFASVSVVDATASHDRGSYSPEVVLALGLAFAVLASSLTFFAQQARARQHAAEQAQRALETSERKLRAIFDQTVQFIGLLSPEGRVLAGNRSALEFAGVTEAAVAGRPFWETPWWTHSPEQQRLLREAVVRAARGELVRFETTHRDKHGETHHIDFSLKPVLDERGQVTLLIPEGRDITDRKRAEEQLARAAHLDKLTGLPNRGLFLDRLQQTIARANRSQLQNYAVMFLDFDRFKLINDSLGHDAGDALLQQIAQRLQESVRGVDSVSLVIGGNSTARLGGDEFVVLLDELENPCDVIVVAERLLAAFAQPYQLGTSEVFSTASIGIVTANPQYERAEEVLRDADTAMYEAKHAGRARFCVFDASMRQRVRRRTQLEIDLRKAPEAGQLALVYQPILSLATGEIKGVEALVRWNHPGEGMIEPGEFIPLAEESDLIFALGEWILTSACRQMRAWSQSLGAAAPALVSVNLSRRELASPTLLKQLRRILAETGLDARQLQMEVSENSLATNHDAVIETLRQLRGLGVQVAIDDYGTGGLSLAAFKRVPINMLKVDGRLLTGIEASKDVAALMHSLAVLVKNLGICLVAEGVETRAQALALQELGCEHAQGFLLSSPLQADGIESFVSRSSLFDQEAAGATAFSPRWSDCLTLAGPVRPPPGA